MRGSKFPKVRHIGYILILLLVFVSVRVLSRQQNVSAAACSASAITVTQISNPMFYVDYSVTPNIDSGYVAYRVQTGSSTSFSDLWVNAGSFSDSTKLTLAPNEDGNYRVGATGTSTTKYTYFYLKGTPIVSGGGANYTPAPAQNYVLSFYNGNPSSGGVLNCTVNVSNTGVTNIIKASANRVNNVTTTTPYLGGQITMTVDGETGNMGASNLFTYTPASTLGWLADCFVLRGANLSYTGGNTGSASNGLFINFPNGANTNYTIVYTFDVRCDTASVTPITPKSDINSGGANMKHTDTGTATYQAIAAISPTQKTVVVSKSVSPTSVALGASTPSYTISLTNSGPTDVVIDSIRDTLPNTPASVTYNNGTSIFNGTAYANPSIVGQTLTWTGPFTIPAGTTRNMLYSVSVPSTLGTYINSAVAFIDSLQIDTTNSTSDNSPATTKYYVGIPNFSTSTKSVEDLNGGTLKPGETLRYTITVKNTGTGSGTLVNVIDNIDSDTQNLTNVLTTNCGTVTNSSSSSQLNLSNVTVGTLNNCVITFDVTVKTPLNEGTEIANSASISGGEQNGTGANPSSSSLFVDATPNLIATKTADVLTPIVVHEQVIDYSVSISNTGDGAATGVSFTDVIDSDVTYNPATITYTNCGSPSQSFVDPTLTVSNITINAGATCQVHFQVTVKLSALHNDIVINGADVSAAIEGGNDPAITNAVDLTIEAAPNLSTSTKSVEDVNGGAVEPGDLLRYTIWIINTDTGPGSGITLTDTIDTDTENLTNVTFQNCGSPDDISTTSTELIVTNITASVDVDCRVTFDVTVKSSVAEGAEISNTAHVGQAAEGGESADPSSPSLFVDTTPVIAISKTDDDADNVVDLLQTVKYTLTLSNSGNGPGTVTVTDTVTGSTSNIKNVVLTNCGGLYGTTITGQQLTITNVVVGIVNDCVITYEIDVNANAPGLSLITNTADASAPSEGGTDPSPSSADNLTVHEDPLLTVTKVDDDIDNSVEPDQEINYTIEITNSGNASTITSLEDTLTTGFNEPQNITFTNCGTPATNYSPPVLSINSIEIGVGATCQIKYMAKIVNELNEGTTLYNTVDVARADPTKGNDPAPVSSDTLTIDATPNLSTSTKTVTDLNGGVVEPGDTLRYTITLINTGNGQGTDVSITDPIDFDVDNLAVGPITNCGVHDDISTEFVVAVEDITVQVGADCVIIYEVNVKSVSTEGTEISNTVDISPALEGGTTTYASSTTLYVDVTPSFVTSTKTVEDKNGGVVAPGDILRYVITLINSGDGLATGVSVVDLLDEDTDLSGGLDIENCGSFVNNSTTSNINLDGVSVDVGINCVISYEVIVKLSAVDGTEITNSADIGAADEGGSGKTVESSKLYVDVIVILDVSVTENDVDNFVLRSQIVTYTTTITNSGNVNVSGINVNAPVIGPSSFVTDIVALNCGPSTINGSSGQVLSLTNINISLLTPCVITFKVNVNPTAKSDDQIKMSADVSAASEGGNNPSAVNADTLVVQAPEIIPTISFESLTQVSITEYRITYLAKLASVGTLPVTNSQILMSLKPLLNSGEEVEVIGTELVDPFASNAVLNGAYNGDTDEYLIANNPNTGVQLDARGGNDTGVIRVRLRLIVPFGENIPDLSVVGSTDELTSNSNLVNVVLPDADKDGFIDTTESNTNDRDGDGVVDSEDFDPQGVFYCTDNGKIIPGGKIAVSGPGNITVIADGSGGFYQWFASGKPGVYEMTLTAPTGTEVATELINTGILDPTGKDNPYSLGSNQYKQSGKLADFTAASNPVYLKFDIASGDPWIINNNIPLKNCGALALTSIQNDIKNTAETNPRRLIIVGAVLLAALAVFEVFWHRRAMEKAIKPGKKFIVAAGNPRRIIARKYGIDNYIERISGKTMTDRTTTSSIHYAGWLKKTVKPGDKGLSIIGGHVYGKHKNGAFLKLNEFEKDDVFEIEFGNGTVRKFIVESVRLVKPADVKRLVHTQDKDIEKQVNLITFADRYDRKTRYTQERVLVIGRLDEEESDRSN